MLGNEQFGESSQPFLGGTCCRPRLRHSFPAKMNPYLAWWMALDWLQRLKVPGAAERYFEQRNSAMLVSPIASRRRRLFSFSPCGNQHSPARSFAVTSTYPDPPR